MSDVTIDPNPVTDTGTDSYRNEPRPDYTSGHGEPTNTVEKPGNVTYEQGDFSEGVDNVTDDRERTSYQWPGAPPETAKKKSSKK